MNTALTIALAGFLGLVALSIVLDSFVKLTRARADARLPRDLRYCHDDLSLAVEAAIVRTNFLRAGVDMMPGELIERVRDGVLVDLEEGNLESFGVKS